MTISYNWLSEYLPEKLSPQELSTILTSLGLEVESIEMYEEFKGGLKGLIVGEVVTCEKHPGRRSYSSCGRTRGRWPPLSGRHRRGGPGGLRIRGGGGRA